MTHSTDTTRPPRQIAAVVAALALTIGLGVAAPVASPATAQVDATEPPTVQPIERGPATDEASLIDPAFVSFGPGLEPAAVAANFNRGYIISDYAFYNRNAMTEVEIQQFLEQRISGPCKNTRCLTILRQSSESRAATPRCDAYQGGASEPVSRIIYKVQVACGVSAKVLLVTLQKEQGLITNTEPTERAVTYALGYGCPDTSPCDPASAGIAVQLYSAASQFQRYRLNPGGYRHQVGVAMDIATHPRTFWPIATAVPPQCPSIRVTIRNQATAGLYNYTPYTPNDAALSNLYTTGDSCSSYGNRNFWRLYTDWFGSPTTLVPSGVQTARLAGRDRYATAVEVSEYAYPAGADVVYLAVGNNFPDGLAAAPAATVQGGPLLLVARTSIPTVVASELQRLAPKRVVIAGSEAVVDAAVVRQLATLLPGVVVDRDAGQNRYQTAIALSQRGFPSATTAFIATGENFPDALAASAAAGHLSGPVLLVRSKQTTLDGGLAAELARLGVSTVYIAGSPAVVTSELETALRALPGITTVERLQGRDRFATASAINAKVFSANTQGFIASGLDFPDALGAAAAAGALDSPLHLSNGVCTPTASLQQLVSAGVQRVSFVGGSPVLRSTVTEFLTCG